MKKKATRNECQRLNLKIMEIQEKIEKLQLDGVTRLEVQTQMVKEIKKDYEQHSEKIRKDIEKLKGIITDWQKNNREREDAILSLKREILEYIQTMQIKNHDNHKAIKPGLIIGKVRKLTIESICQCLPYGVICTWNRMLYGSNEEKPLFYYGGVCKRFKRIVKFSLPYGVCRFYRCRRWGF